MKYSIVVPYFTRDSFCFTMDSYKHHYGNRKDFEVIVVEDTKTNSYHHDRLTEMINRFKSVFSIKYSILNNPGFMADKLFNYGVSIAAGEIIVLTSPECFHQSNVLQGLDTEFVSNQDKYVVCACRNVELIRGSSSFDNFKCTELDWLQHSTILNRRLHFCSALLKTRYKQIGGFDEEYNKGIMYDDDDFLRKIQNTKIPIVTRDDLMVLHIKHGKNYQTDNWHLCEVNRQYFNKKWNENLPQWKI